jgi:PAS domain S-box-containing protein
VHLIPNQVEGEVRGLYVLFHDVTELTESRQTLAQQRQRLENIIQRTQLGTWEWNAQTGETRFNERWAEISGCTLAELAPLGLDSWRSRVHPDDLEPAQQRLADHVAGKLDSYECELRTRHADGRWIWVVERGRVLTRSADGAAEWMYGVREDITIKKLAQQRLAESERFLERAGRAAGVGAWQLDLQTGMQTWSAETRRIYEVPPDFEPVEDAGLAFFPAEAREQLQRSIQCTLDTGQGWDLELPLTTGTGRQIWVRTVGALEHEAGRAVRVIGALQDVTVRRAADQALREATLAAEAASAAKSEFLANMSHELRTPLNGVIGLAYLLEHTTLDEQQRGYLAQMQLSSRALLGVINDVLYLSKIEAGELTLEDAPFDLRALLSELAQRLTVSAESKQLQLTIPMVDDAHRLLRGDATRLQQILVNLLSNAIKFTERGEVGLQVSFADCGSDRLLLRCEVRDSGIGIAKEAQHRLFAPFTQVDASTTRRFGGTGLGLSIVKRLTQLMGGEVGVESELGEGSLFWVSLPMTLASLLTSADDPAQAGNAALVGRAGREDTVVGGARLDPGAQWLPGARVLVVDDSDLNVEVVQHILEREGAEVTSCHTGLEALACLRARPTEFDVVLMDVQMPQMDGNEATRRLRNELALRLPVIALTAGALVAERERSLDAGLDDFISKPIDPQQLIRLVRRHVERGRGQVLSVRPRGGLTAGPALSWPAPAAPENDIFQHTALSGAVWPHIEGIDREGAAQRLNGDFSRFARLLQHLLSDFHDLLSCSAMPAQPALLGRLCELRGSASTLGALELEHVIDDAEQALQQGRPEAEAKLRVVADVLGTLERDARHVLAQSEPAAAGGATAGTPRASGRPPSS